MREIFWSLGNRKSTLSICRGGKTPEVSFEEAGIPDDFIAYFAPLVRKPIQFDSRFISSSTRDQEFAHYFHSDLENSGARFWFAPHDTQGGKLPERRRRWQ